MRPVVVFSSRSLCVYTSHIITRGYHIRIPLCRRHHRHRVQITQLSCVSLKFTTSVLLLPQLPTMRNFRVPPPSEVQTIITIYYYHRHYLRNIIFIYVVSHEGLLRAIHVHSQIRRSPGCVQYLYTVSIIIVVDFTVG